MVFTEDEQRVVKGVFGELLRRHDINSFLGSITIEEMSKIYYKLRHEPYCEKYGIKLEDMTEDDFIREYEEENYISESEWYEIHEDTSDSYEFYYETEDDYYGSDYEY